MFVSARPYTLFNRILNNSQGAVGRKNATEKVSPAPDGKGRKRKCMREVVASAAGAPGTLRCQSARPLRGILRTTVVREGRGEPVVGGPALAIWKGGLRSVILTEASPPDSYAGECCQCCRMLAMHWVNDEDVRRAFSWYARPWSCMFISRRYTIAAERY
ncbi:unnamed protein product [Nesidiocoris tenuis]|uniref:Uncharacterized protein n=1 Tax=Nesidiocoris tenuis TaxID=355587 RepID=A0A6H5GJH9_9HEMI|nr:unnamed protein product [Nesidiocoris tenuis]